MSKLNNSDLSKFLQFCTGSPRVPITGFRLFLFFIFSLLESNRGNVAKFCINYVEFNENLTFTHYIRAHTCFNRIDLPKFPNYKQLEDSIDFIIKNENITGFGIE